MTRTGRWYARSCAWRTRELLGWCIYPIACPYEDLLFSGFGVKLQDAPIFPGYISMLVRADDEESHWRRDPERGLQSWFRPAKPETRNRLLKLVSNCETRNPKPKTDSEDLTSPGPIETRNPKPETDSEDLPSPGPIETRNPKPETDSEDLSSPGPIETRNPKPETDC